MSGSIVHDVDQLETQDWLAALEAVLKEDGVDRAKYLLEQLAITARSQGVALPTGITTDYINTIAPQAEPAYPGDISIERRIRSIIRWNAIMIVLRASKKDLDLGGHMASYQSAAAFYEVGFNHFFRAANDTDGGDLVFYQGHISPGIYARAFVEGRLTAEQLDGFRQEVEGEGLP
ncbi:MAG: pyruvate dehydrogenase (acetyl-transferring), homodimeric type, partial [Ferrimonas sp.]